MPSRPFPPPAPAVAPARSIGFLLAYALATAGGAVSYLPLLTLLLPAKVERIAGDARLGLLTDIAVAGAVAASAANIAFGWLSDRSVAAGGGRRRWMAAGIAATALAYAALIAAATPFALVAAILLFQVAINALLAPLAAIMADEIPDAQKGVAAGLLAFAAPGAFALSAVLAGMAGIGEAGRLAVLPAAVAVLTLPLMLVPARPVATPVPQSNPGPDPEPGPRPRPGSPRRDLAVAWAARLLVQIAGVVLSLYLLYYFESVAPAAAQAPLARRVGELLAFASAAALPAAVSLGRLSDRAGRRKPFLLAATILAAGGLAVMAASTGWRAAALGFGRYTTGAAVFLALHAGFAMQLLPDPRHRGRDLGLMNLANTLPSMIGPPLAWLLATPHDFSWLLAVLAVLMAGGGAATLAVRGRR